MMNLHARCNYLPTDRHHRSAGLKQLWFLGVSCWQCLAIRSQGPIKQISVVEELSTWSCNVEPDQPTVIPKFPFLNLIQQKELKPTSSTESLPSYHI